MENRRQPFYRELQDKKPMEFAMMNGKNYFPYPLRPDRPDCWHYLRCGSCPCSWNCKFNHPIWRKANQGNKPHHSFLPYGTDNYANNNMLHYPNSAAVEGPIPFSRYGNDGLPSYPSGAPQHDPTFMPVRRTCDASLPRSSGSSSCMVLEHSAYRRVISNPEMYYQGPQKLLHPPGDSVFHSQVRIKEAPEVSSQLECPFRIAYGECNLKSWCRFQHPTPYVPTCVLTSVGLPLRPDQEICPSYRRWGICKFGRSCKYNHSLCDDSSASSSSSESEEPSCSASSSLSSTMVPSSESSSTLGKGKMVVTCESDGEEEEVRVE